MSMTTELLNTCTIMPGGQRPENRVNELLHNYLKLVQEQKLGWTEHLRLSRVLGRGGQGIVYLSERRGADNFTLPVALKFFSPERFPDERTYREAMERMAAVSSQVAQIQHDNLLDVQNFIERGSIRVLEMGLDPGAFGACGCNASLRHVERAAGCDVQSGTTACRNRLR